MKSKKLLVLYGLVLSIAFGADANAIENKPLENFFIKFKETTGKDSNVSLGYRMIEFDNFLKNVRVEQNFSQKLSIYDKQGYGKTKVMSNVIYGFAKHSGVTPYIGAGVGFTRDMSFDQESESSHTTPSYQLITGMSYVTPKYPSLKLQLGYSYSDGLNGASKDNNIIQKQYDINGEESHAIAGIVKFNF